MAEGIRRRHSKGCPAKVGGRCRCNAGWEASVYVARRGGKVRRTFPRKSEARAWRTDALAERLVGGSHEPTQLTLEQAAWLWLEAARNGSVRDRSGQTYKPGTLREYARVLDLRVLPEFGDLRFSELPRSEIQRFVDELLATGLAPSTVRNTINPLQAMYRHAVRRDVVTVNPTREVELPAERGRRDRIATAAEAARLIAALSANDRPIWATAFYGGLRRGELQALRVSDVDLSLAELSVRRSWDHVEGPIAPKSRAGLRTLPIIGVLHSFLADLAGSTADDSLIFGRLPDAPFDPKTINDRAKRAWKAANEAEQEAAEQEGRDPDLLRPITLHECRHTFASLLIDAGVNPKAIQEFMGHATIEETFSRYGHLMPGARNQARLLLDSYMETALNAA